MKKPLAVQMRPKNLDDILGQQHLVGENQILRRMVEEKQLSSMILYGNPGIGKTSIAIALATSIGLPYRILNATTHNKKDMEAVVAEAKMSNGLVLILDEVHRLDKGKQDFLLPHVESGLLTLIGATTANPYFSINPAIRSRCHIFELQPLTWKDIHLGLERALKQEYSKTTITEEALLYIAKGAGGDIRTALNALELAIVVAPTDSNMHKEVTLAIVKQCMQKTSFVHDKDGDAHYDTLSAFQKSIRGSDVDAALHYLARLIVSGDLESICRRLLVIAYEDISLANPDAGAHTLAVVQTVERLGLPEARIPLANIVIELCLSPKTNAPYMALDAAIADIHEGKAGAIPLHLRDAHYKGAKELGRGIEYLYPHDFHLGKFGGWVKQNYLPDSLKNTTYYAPKEAGNEERLKKLYEAFKKQK
ncbi:MAG: replication-associated recombination protein A [Bacillaceae bacterium]